MCEHQILCILPGLLFFSLCFHLLNFHGVWLASPHKQVMVPDAEVQDLQNDQVTGQSMHFFSFLDSTQFETLHQFYHQERQTQTYYIRPSKTIRQLLCKKLSQLKMFLLNASIPRNQLSDVILQTWHSRFSVPVYICSWYSTVQYDFSKFRHHFWCMKMCLPTLFGYLLCL
jgi:hypothetical protein